MRSSTNIVLAFFVAAFLLVVHPALAHSTVSPARTFTQKSETFSLSVPTERDVPTVGVRLLIPPGLDRVTPIVQPGWQITVQKDGEDRVTEILWTGGSIPAGQKQLFLFSARAPQEATKLIWKVYQTYQGGEVVGWERDPNEKKEGEEKVLNPYSVTEVVSDTPAPSTEETSGSTLPMTISVGALVISLVALGLSLRRK